MTFSGRGITPGTIREWQGSTAEEIQTPIGVPSGGVEFDVLQRVVQRKSIQIIRRVSTLNGTDLVLGGDPTWLSADQQFYKSFAYATAYGAPVVVTADPMPDYGVSFVLKDTVTSRTFLIGSHGDTPYLSEGTGRIEVGNISPYTPIGSVVPVQDGSNDITDLADALAPGTGRHYYLGLVLGTSSILTWNIAANTTLAAVPWTSFTTSMMWDGSVAKYGDGKPRIHVSSPYAGLGRASVDTGTGLPTVESSDALPSGVAPGGLSGWTTPFSDITIDGAANSGYIVSANGNDSTPYLLKYSLHPLGTTQYFVQVSTVVAFTVFSVVHDPATQQVVVLWNDYSIPGTAVINVSVFHDTGSAFTLGVTHSAGAFGQAGSDTPWAYPKASVLQGRAFLPIWGKSSNDVDYPLTDDVLVLDLANPTYELRSLLTSSVVGWERSPVDTTVPGFLDYIIHVDLDGLGDDNENNGTAGSPFASLSRARQEIGDRNGGFVIEIVSTSGRSSSMTAFSIPRKGIGRTEIVGKSFTYSHPTLAVISITDGQVLNVSDTLSPGALAGQILYNVSNEEKYSIYDNDASSITVVGQFYSSTASDTFRVGVPLVKIKLSSEYPIDFGGIPELNGTPFTLRDVEFFEPGGNTSLMGFVRLDGVRLDSSKTIRFVDGRINCSEEKAGLTTYGGSSNEIHFTNMTGQISGSWSRCYFTRCYDPYGAFSIVNASLRRIDVISSRCHFNNCTIVSPENFAVDLHSFVSVYGGDIQVSSIALSNWSFLSISAASLPVTFSSVYASGIGCYFSTSVSRPANTYPQGVILGNTTNLNGNIYQVPL